MIILKCKECQREIKTVGEAEYYHEHGECVTCSGDKLEAQEMIECEE